MIEPIVITIPGKMLGKGRPRFSARDRNGQPLKFVRTFTDSRTEDMETWVRACADKVFSGPPLEGPLAMAMDIVVMIPASWSKKKQAAAQAGQLLPTGKPDLDNTTKLIADALNQIVWKDDSQIASMRLNKRYGLTPQTTLTITRLG
ncbi:RusA family crossover junction endodeoxyribonuclease [Falsiroseomonas tokyonensis]|uniref:RusA family crossover junction endodeoxyribonuclease n=1 Tax=Falsiroseomonas tokyonensis TaxID=430521 RepID=A0ABV7BX33_9PROT|nr:RusA family crossover junction endodeoxyribonuclease [Falsiroseomonas tokyonensis]MBU8540218.1 RusA family crossover junction endodeoxyribonuclease [Falsiroseomonas tokyonensis]